MLKIQFLNGGLANQVFQYIFARYYELSHSGEIMYMDDSYFALNMVHNGYELEKVFGLKPHMLSELFDEEVWEYILSEKRKGKSVPQILLDNGEPFIMVSELNSYNSFNPFNGEVYLVKETFNPKIQDIPENVYYHGYWVNKEWFIGEGGYEEIFRKELQFPPMEDDRNRRWQEDIVTGNSVSIHIRRGDYVSLGYAFDIQIYHELIDRYIKDCSNDWTLYVFSDDIAWCRTNSEALGLNLFRRTVFVEGNTQGNNFRDIQLMSQCKGMIISNSSFCYLAALLNTNKKCVLNRTDRDI